MTNQIQIFADHFEKDKHHFSVSSDIGQSLAERKLNDGYNVFGTYRTSTRKLEQLKNKGVKLIHADFSDSSVGQWLQQLKESCKIGMS